MVESSKSKPSASGRSLLAASAEGAKLLFLLQLSSRLLTFLVNQLLLRYLSPGLLGISVQLEVLTISILYFARESLRNALQRQLSTSTPKASGAKQKSGELKAGTPAAEAQTVVNLSLLTVPLGAIFAVVLSAFYIRSTSQETSQQPWLNESVGLYVVATLLELLSEPGFSLAQQRMLYKLRAGAESAAAVTRCVLTCGITVYSARKGIAVGPLPFAIGQLGHGLVLLLVYNFKIWGLASAEGFSAGLRRIRGGNYWLLLFHHGHTSLATTMWIQSSIKHVLTQGDSILVAWWTTNADQGFYALASNYGSLIARLVFQPLEEASRNLFAKLLSPMRGKVDQESLSSAARILKTMLKLYLLLSIFAVSLGPPFAPVVLRIIAGSRWGDSAAGQVLGTYCYYIPLLAVNGITESFVQSVADKNELHQQSAWMFSFFLGFALAGYGFVKTLGWGAQGLVWANVVNMALRIAWSSTFVRGYFARMGKKDMRWSDVLPQPVVIAAAIGVAAVGRGFTATSGQAELIKELAVAGSLGVGLLGVCAFFERRFFMECASMMKSVK